jgi:uncharacterized protein YjbI with pentapeptide repeats
MHSSWRHLAIATLVVVAACSGDNATDSSEAPSPSASEPSPDSTQPATTVTVPEPQAVPAGVNWNISTLTQQTPAAAVPFTFEQITATAGVPPAPAGFPYRQSVYISQVFDLGGVLLASGSCGCWEGGDSSGVFGGLRSPVYLFRSADAGVSWSQVDLSGALGDANGAIEAVVEHDGELVLTATITDAAAITPSVIAVLRSADAIAWQRVGTVAGDAATTPVRGFRLYPLGDALVLYGGDLVCQFDGADAIQSIGPTFQHRLWVSSDGGSTWAAQERSVTGLDADRPPLPDAAGCASLDLMTIRDTYAIAPRLLQLAGDRLMVWSSDGSRIVSSTDGSNWASAALDGALPLASDVVPAPAAGSLAATIIATDDGFVAMNLEPYRNFDDTATDSSVGLHVITWSSTDGETWTRQPLGRPLLVTEFGSDYEFFVVDGRLAVRSFDRITDAQYWTYESTQGVAEDWSVCVPAAGANCSFADSVVVGGITPGDDLSGIDLSYTLVEGIDLSAVSFAGARLRSTAFSDVTLDGTVFDGADLTYTTIGGDPSTASFVGATISRAYFDGRFFLADLTGATLESVLVSVGDDGLPAGVSLVGRDLTKVEFGLGDMSNVDFSGANLTSSSFGSTDLTGANFAGALLDGVSFYDVTCPDGLPITDGASGAAACRL